MRHRKNIYFTRVVITLVLLGHQISHLENKYCFPSCTIYYFVLEDQKVYSFTPWRANKSIFLQSGHKVHFISPRGAKKSIYILANHNVRFIAPSGSNNPFFDPLVGKNRVRHRKNIYFTHVVFTLTLLVDQTSHSKN